MVSDQAARIENTPHSGEIVQDFLEHVAASIDMQQNSQENTYFSKEMVQDSLEHVSLAAAYIGVQQVIQ